MTIRYAIWAVVSTKKQAKKDKDSLDKQISSGHKAGKIRSWKETAGPYRVPGASRSFYVNLSDAEKDIPELARMLNDARAGKFDVLIIYSYDRLGDLADMIAQTLAFYGVQIFSVSQAVEPQDPDQFDPYESDAESNMRSVHRITQRFRIADLRRKWYKHVPARVEKGLPPLSIAFGYDHVNSKKPPRLDRSKVQLLIDMKNWFLQHVPSAEIARRADATGIKPRRAKRWHGNVIRRMMENPFYAGFVSFGRTASERDTRVNRKKRYRVTAESEWQIAKGLHEPIWDEATWRALMAESERRQKTEAKGGKIYATSGLFSCTVCGAPLDRHTGSVMGRPCKTLSCRHIVPQHVVIEYDLAQKLFLIELKKALDGQDPAAPRPTDPAQQDAWRRQIKNLNKQRRQVQEGYEAGVYKKKEAAEKIDDLEEQIQQLEHKLERGSDRSKQLSDFQTTLGAFKQLLPHLHEYLAEGDPRAVRHTLKTLIKTVTVSPDYKFTIHWQD